MSQKGIPYKKQARKMILMVYNFIKSDAETNNISLTANDLEQKTADATKASLSSVRMILEEAKYSNYSADNSVTSGKKRPRPQKQSNFSLLEQGLIKRIIHNFHVTENEILTMEKLTRKLANEICYEGSESGLRGTVKALGFRWKKVEGGRKLLIEKSDIRFQRIEYLQKLRNYRREGRNIIYAHHTYIRPKQHNRGAKKSTVETYAGVFSASTDNAIITNTIHTVLVFSASKVVYDDNFYQNYEEWINKHLIPNIPDNSVVVISCAKYHNKEYDAIPTSCDARSEMIAWLDNKGIHYEKKWLKPQLYGLIKTYNARNKIFFIDKLLNDENHSVLRIPMCHTDLSPLEIIWNDIKEYIKDKDIGKFTELNVRNAVIEKINSMEMEFKKLCRNIKDIEQSYRKSDYVIDMLTEECKFYDGESSDNDEPEYDDSSDEEVKVKIERLE